jgi:FkbM family methyltransferase
MININKIVNKYGLGYRLQWLWRIYKKVLILLGCELNPLDTEYLRCISQFIKKGDTVLDIGANIGLWSGRFNKMVDSSGTVYAFEPIPQTFNNLSSLWHDKKNIILINIALSDVEKTVEFIIPKSGYSLPTSAISSTADQISINSNYNFSDIHAYPLDLIYENLNISACSFIKCDVEGHEYEVMKGANNFISKFKPNIFVEICEEKWIDNNPLKSNISIYLYSLGYKSYQILNGRMTEEFSKSSENFFFIIRE